MEIGGRPLRGLALFLVAMAFAGCRGEGATEAAEAARLLESMDLRARAEQLVLPPLRLGPDTAAAAAQLREAAAGRLTGVWVAGGDAEVVARAVARLRRASPVPILVAAPVDGGVRVARATALPGAALMAAVASDDDARVAGELIAREARAVGINLGFVAAPPMNVTGELAYAARSPSRTGAGLRAHIEGARRAGLAIGVLALWTEAAPGPLLTWDRARLEAVELAALREILAGEPEAISFGALRLPSLTGDSTPLPLSAAAVGGLARRQLGFGGLVIADGSPGSAIGRRNGVGEATVRAIAAGVDLLVRIDDPRAAVDAIVAAVESGRIPARRVETAARRVLTTRLRAAAAMAADPPDSLARVLGTTAAAQLAQRLRRRVAAPVLPAPVTALSPAGAAAALDSLAGIDSVALARVDQILRAALDDSVFTGAALAVGRRGTLVRLTGYGRDVDPRTTIFDVASLTKVLATTTAVALLTERGLMELDAPLSRYLPEFRGGDRDDVTVRHLLTHTSGLPAGLWLFGSARSPADALRQTVAQELLRPPGEAVEYSDLGMILLAEAAERAAEMPIDRFLALNVYAPLGMQSTMFLPPFSLRPRILPSATTTERDFTLQGIVHDANAFRLGGVAGHAGLFSTARDMGVFAQMILNGGSYGSTRVLLPATVASFTTLNQGTGTRALGWDTPADRSSAGRFLSARSFGHTGYTGTSLWIDPDRELFVVLLTNRTLTGASSSDVLRLRAAVHDAVAAAVKDVPATPRPGSRRVD